MKRRNRHPFTIIELLVVTFIIGIVLTLAIAPFDKLTTVAGVDGAVNMISTKVQACRQHAVSKRTRVALILYREGLTQAIRTAELDKSNGFEKWTANSSWTYLPTGAVVETVTNGEDVALTAAELNPISATDRTYKAVIFKPTGKLANSNPLRLKISDDLWDGSNYTDRGDGNNWQNLTVNKYTGQVTVAGP